MKQVRHEVAVQGDLDRLCGLYSIVNAVACLLDQYRESEKLRLDLFRCLLDRLGDLKPDKSIGELCTQDIKFQHMGKLLKRASSELDARGEGRLCHSRVTHRKPDSFDDFWALLSSRLGPRCVGLVLRQGHWFVVTQVENDELFLADSLGDETLKKSQCGLSPSSEYPIHPTKSYFIALEAKH